MNILTRNNAKESAIESLCELINKCLLERAKSGDIRPELFYTASENANFVKRNVLPLYQDSGWDLEIVENQSCDPKDNPNFSRGVGALVKCNNINFTE